MHPNYKTICLEVPASDSKAMDKFQEGMDLLQDMYMAEEQKLMKNLGVSNHAASLVLYLRSRSRWSQEKEDYLIQLDKAGKELPNVLAGEF